VITQVKICGITNEEDALLAASLGASYLGMIFVHSSPRHIEPGEARRIAARLKGQVKLVGVFQDEASSKINYMVDALDLDYVQLHGMEQPDFCSEISSDLIKVVQLSFAGDDLEPRGKARRYEEVALVAELQRYPYNVKHFLFDRPKRSQRDGWLENAMARLERVQENCKLPPFFFAGGLNSLNVGGVIERLHPFGIDVASGIEVSPGIKDKRMMAEFMESCMLQNITQSGAEQRT
jgi:phosphoribosylanthranilate isomerase